jgi:hypothetical protein
MSSTRIFLCAHSPLAFRFLAGQLFQVAMKARMNDLVNKATFPVADAAVFQALIFLNWEQQKIPLSYKT